MACYPKDMVKSRSGFTIIELLIVIVVIAILATISIVAFRGVQQRANNTKTLGAVNAYIKALGMYKADNGQYPPATACLGTGYPNPNGSCHSDGSYSVNGGGLNTTYLSRYFGSSPPTPATNTGEITAGIQFGGAIYVWNTGGYGGANNGGIGLYSQGSTDCPSVGSLTFMSSQAYSDGSGAWCRYSMN